jgi:hypothetical protein
VGVPAKPRGGAQAVEINVVEGMKRLARVPQPQSAGAELARNVRRLADRKPDSRWGNGNR